MILIIDNYDSFTYNLAQQIESLGEKVTVLQNDKTSIAEIKKIKPDKIIISPGPQTPKQSGISKEVIEEFYKTKPILGVCLGHQCIGEVFGVKTIHANKVMHGKTSKIKHNNKHIFKNTSKEMEVARYHSLIIDKLPTEFELCAWTEEKEIMAIKHKDHQLFGIQFHPESFLTTEGNQLMQNFLNE